MGKFEVLGWLLTERMAGDERFFRYRDIHEGMKRAGVSFSYTSVWRSVLSLHTDHMLEVEFEGELLRRNPRFRARLPTTIQSSDMKRVHNTYRKMDQSSGRAVPGEPVASERERPAVALASVGGRG